MPGAGAGEIRKGPCSVCLDREFLRLTRASRGGLPTLGELKVGSPQKHSGLFLLSLHNTELLTAIIYEILRPCGLAGLSWVALPLLGGWLGLLTWLHSAGAWLGQPSPGLAPVAGSPGGLTPVAEWLASPLQVTSLLWLVAGPAGAAWASASPGVSLHPQIRLSFIMWVPGGLPGL